ncbi:MAG: ABC transporter substrate-binding protein [Gammaproteobacteria bacterium]|jgi:ABC-type nitrate/sulfonate/bicarbonate transport system substrate-binding protein
MTIHRNISALFSLLVLIFSFLIPILPVNAQQEPILVPLTDVSTNKLPYIVAKEEGLFDKYGISIELYMTPGAALKGGGDGMTPNPEYIDDPDTDRLLSTGGGVGQIHRRVTEGGDRVILGTTGNILTWWLYAHEDIKTVEDLKGKTISGTGDASCTGAAIHILANRMGWKVGEDITLVKNSEHRVDKLLEGVYDAVMAAELPDVYARNKGMKPLIDMGDWGLPFVCSGISASKAWLETGNNRETARRFLMATIEAIAIMKQRPETVYHALEKWYGVSDPAIQKQMYAYIDDLPKKPYPSVGGIKLIMDTYEDIPEMQNFITEDFYDDSLMREIDESGFIDALYQ